jgi:hypothetical protein
MRLIIAGCEYSGTTTLAFALAEWGKAAFGRDGWELNGFHDHWKFPHVNNFQVPATEEEIAAVIAEHSDARDGDWSRTGLSEEEQQMVLGLNPKLKEMFQRYHLQYHLHPSFYKAPDHIMVGAHIEEAIYGPLYFGYGAAGQYADRGVAARHYEEQILDLAPDTVLVLVKASPEAIAWRMEDNPHHNGVLLPKDIKTVLGRFEEEHEASLLRYKVAIDTSDATVQGSLEELISKIRPFMPDADRERM